MLGGGRPLDVNGLTNWKLAPTPLHHAPGSTHLRDVRCGNRLRPVRDSCQSLSQLRIGKLRDLVEVPLYDPRKACNQQLGFAQVVGILFADRFRLMGRVGLSPALDPLHPTELGSVCQATPKPPVQPQISLDDEVGQIVRQGAREGIAGNTKPNAVTAQRWSSGDVHQHGLQRFSYAVSRPTASHRRTNSASGSCNIRHPLEITRWVPASTGSVFAQEVRAKVSSTCR